MRADIDRARARAALGALALLSFLLALSSPALAGPPTHLRSEAQDISGFNHACGAAVDSKGDVYVASAGESKVRIFNPAHTELTSIANANEPCGLAVDSKGALYVSEKATGKVLRYVPNAYPFAGTPTYGAPVTIDNSGAAKGISVDPTVLVTNSGFVIGGDDSLYIAKGDHIDTYRNESQRINVQASGGSYTLTFNGQKTAALPYTASHAEVQAALEALSTIGAGNVSVTTGNFAATDHLITFIHALGLTDVSKIEVDASALTGASIVRSETQGGFVTSIGTGALTNATGVAAYTYVVNKENSDRYLFAADAATNQVKVFSGPNLTSLKLRRTIKGPKAGEDFGFGAAGAYLAVDPGNGDPVTEKCSPIAEQACTAGHLLVYDEAHKAVDEFEATGEFLDQLTDPGLADAKPTALAVERSGGPNDGAIYVSTGAGAGAKLLAFGPLAAPSRAPLPALSRVLAHAEAVATDSAGDVYAAADTKIYVYDPAGKPLSEFEDNKLGLSRDLAVDSTGKVYVLENGEQVTYYTPAAYPPLSGTAFTRHEPPVATLNDFPSHGGKIMAIGVNPANDHVFAAKRENADVIELASAKEGSAILNPCFACGIGHDYVVGIAAHGASGNVYMSAHGGTIFILDKTGAEVLARIGGKGGLKGTFAAKGPNPAIAVDQSSGHVLAFDNARGVAEEYDASGAFIAQFTDPQFGEFQTAGGAFRLAIDNGASSPGKGNLYLAFDEAKPGSPDLWAFGPLAYGEAPIALTGAPDGLGAGDAILHGSVDPRGFDLTDCRFEYLSDAQYLSNGKTFAGATAKPCAESLAEIGKGAGAVPVHAEIGGLDPEGRYRCRLVAKNKYGESKGEACLFGPPLLTTEPAQPISYTEATLRAQIDPSGLATEYRFEYGLGEGYGQSTPTIELPAGEVPVLVQAPLTGLAEGTAYHFRIVLENEAKAVQGPDQSLETLQRAEPQPSCPNAEFRTGLSANLPDCRAYELVTPADTRGAQPYAADNSSPGRGFNNWLTAPRGEGAGESLSYFIDGTLPGFDGNGRRDGYRAQRAEGPHPATGWTSELFGPSYSQAGGGTPRQHSVASDQLYSFWEITPIEAFEATLAEGVYLRTPTGFEPVGQGSLGADPEAESRYVSPGGAHVVFFSKAQLEPEAPPAGTVAIYDRAAGASSAEVVSLKPDGSSFAGGEDAAYVASSEDGSAVAFEVGGALYVRRDNAETVEVAAAPNTFAGVSEDGERVLYSDAASGEQPAGLWFCEVDGGSCAGPGKAQEPSEIADESIFVNVSAEGSQVYFTSKEALTGAEENDAGEAAEAGERNLYAADGAATRFIAILDSQDLVSFGGNSLMKLSRWAAAIGAGDGIGLGNSPARSTADGGVFVFQSHAQLTPYDNEGFAEVYRYELAAAPGERLICVSCDPSGAPPSADAMLQPLPLLGGSPTQATTLIPNLTEDGGAVFFHSSDRLLPEDANAVQDVYEWKANGAPGCKRAGGCLALISSGQGESDNYLYSMTPDGHDVFFVTREKLLGADVPGSPSIYDARVEGGVPDPPAPAPCQGDACRAGQSPPPFLHSPGEETRSAGNGPAKGAPRPRCPKGKRHLKGRCVKKRHHKRHHGRAEHKRRSQR